MLNPKSQIPNPKPISLFPWLLFSTWCLVFSALISGCAAITEGAKGLAGISTKTLEAGRKNALKKTFNYDYNTCYRKAKDALSSMGAYIYAEDAKKKMIAVYISETDTTAVGLFFSPIDANNTEIKISSPSTYAKEFISKKVFFALDKALNPEKETYETDPKNKE